MDCSLQTPLSMGFSRQEYWSGLPCPSPGALSNLGIEPGSPTLQAGSLPSEPQGNPQEILHICLVFFISPPMRYSYQYGLFLDV